MRHKRLVEIAWISVGVFWFFIFQLIGFLPEDLSVTLITLFGLYMWLAVFFTVGMLGLPFLLRKVKKTSSDFTLTFSDKEKEVKKHE